MPDNVCECPTRAALEAMLYEGSQAYRDRVVKEARAALSNPCPCAGMRERLAQIEDSYERAESDVNRQSKARFDAEAECNRLRDELATTEAEASKLLEYARTVKGSRDVHSIYEVLDLVPTLRAELEHLKREFSRVDAITFPEGENGAKR